MSNTFRVTTKHIDDWYVENRWWFDELKNDELLWLCGIFYIYQRLEKNRDTNLVIQEEPQRKALAEYLRSKHVLNTDTVVYKDDIITIESLNIHPFHNRQLKDIVDNNTVLNNISSKITGVLLNVIIYMDVPTIEVIPTIELVSNLYFDNINIKKHQNPPSKPKKKVKSKTFF